MKNAGMAFHEELKRLRLAKGLTQEALALECGWKGQSRIANYEAAPDSKGARKPDIDGVPVIARALGVGIQELFGFPPLLSQSARPDGATISAAIRLSRQAIKAMGGEPFDPEEDGDIVSQAYVYLLARGQTVVSADNVVDFTQVLRQRKGADDGIERARGTGSAGGDAGEARGTKARKKAGAAAG